MKIEQIVKEAGQFAPVELAFTPPDVTADVARKDYLERVAERRDFNDE